MKIAIDAGHGVHTAGKRTPDDIREWTLNNRVLLAFDKEIKKYQGVTTVRTDDPTGKTDVPLTTRTNKAKQEKCDIFISIHHNAYQAKWGNHTGSETWVYPNRKAEALATALLQAIVKATGLVSRGVKTGDFHVNREVPFPSVLAEIGFMDSNIDHPVITEPKNSEKVGIEMAKAVAGLYGLKVKTEQPKPKPEPTPAAKFKVGDKVQIKDTAKKYATGENIPARYKAAAKYTDTVKQTRTGEVLFTNINSWLKDTDVQSANTSAPAPKPTPTPKPTHNIKVGDRVTYKGALYKDSDGNGKGASVNGTFDVDIVNNNSHGVHLKGKGWVKPSDVKKIGAKDTPIKVGDKVMVLNNVQYNGGRFGVYYKHYDVLEVNGDRVVIGIGKVVTAAINAQNLKKV